MSLAATEGKIHLGGTKRKMDVDGGGDDDPIISLWATLSLPQNSNSISLDVGNTMKTQAKDLHQVIAQKMDDAWQKNVTNNLAHASQLQGISDSVSDFTKMYLKEVLNEKPEATYFGMSHISTVLNVPETKEQKALALGALKDAMESIAESAAESAEYAEMVYEIVQTMQEEKYKPGPAREKDSMKLSNIPAKPRGPLLQEESEVTKSEIKEDLIWNSGSQTEDVLIAQRRLDALQSSVIDSSWKAMVRPFPESVVDAVSMILYTPQTSHPKSKPNYDVKTYLAKYIIPFTVDFYESSQETKRTMALRNLQPSAIYTKDEIVKNVLNPRQSIIPILSVSTKQKTINLEIPIAYAQNSVKGLSAWSNLFGYAAHFRIKTKRGMKNAEKTERIVHQFASLELEHSEEERKKSVKYVFVSDTVKLADGIQFKKSASVRLFGSAKTDVDWLDVTVDVTRVYINSKAYSVLYRNFQQDALLARAKQTTLVRRNQMTFGEANDEKLGQLFNAIIKGQPSPVDFVTDHHITISKNN